MEFAKIEIVEALDLDVRTLERAARMSNTVGYADLANADVGVYQEEYDAMRDVVDLVVRKFQETGVPLNFRRVDP